jgi:hypothetical protein
MNDIIRTSNLIDVAPAMFEHPGARPSPVKEAMMFDILTQKKYCSRCGEWKDFSDFYSSKRYAGGVYVYCKACARAASRKWRNEHLDEARQRANEWEKQNPEKKRENNRKWRLANPLKVLEQNRVRIRRWIENNPKKRREHSLRWAKANPEKHRVNEQNRRARIKANGGNITLVEWESVLQKYGHRCLYPNCERTDLTIDHVVPIALGGTHTVDNVQPLCSYHNRKKGKKAIDYR